MANFNNLVCASALLAVSASGFQFQVGGKGRGWKILTGVEPETYNEWAAKNRFHVGDTLQFKYANDSMVVVNSTDYLSCNKSSPIVKYEDSDTVFEFHRSRLFYFISGQPGHCKLGQRLILRAIYPSEVGEPVLALGLPPALATVGREAAVIRWKMLFVVSYPRPQLYGFLPLSSCSCRNTNFTSSLLRFLV